MAANRVASGAASDCKIPIIVAHESFCIPPTLASWWYSMIFVETYRFLKPLQVLVSMFLGLLLPTPHSHNSSQHIGRRKGLLGSVCSHYVLCSERKVWTSIVGVSISVAHDRPWWQRRMQRGVGSCVSMRLPGVTRVKLSARAGLQHQVIKERKKRSRV